MKRFAILICLVGAMVSCKGVDGVLSGETLSSPDGKLSMLMDWAGKPGREIDDPWYTRDFTGVLRQIEEGCRGFLEKTKHG